MDDITFPALHRQSRRGWINDPNGLAYIDGRYHLFFQFNPEAPVHEAITWGHVSSTDLLSWTEHPVALSPRPDGPDRDGCWTGCVVDDGGVPTAVYTAVRGGPAQGAVALATSDRSLITWRQEPGVLVKTPTSPTVSEARDPFLFSWKGHRYAIQGAGRAEPGSTPSIQLWSCDDLRRWSPLGPLLTGDDPIAAATAPADIWECPGLVQLDNAWVMALSQWRSVGNTFELAGARYLIGDLTERDTGPAFVPTSGGTFDEGPAFYAPQLLALPDRVLTWGWSWELDRSPDQVAAAGWAGTLTSPRELFIVDGRLANRPATELTGWRQQPLDQTNAISEPAFEVTADGPIGLELHTAEGQTTVVGADFFGGGPSRILVDGSLVEAFSPTGSFTTRAYPDPLSTWISDGHPLYAYRLRSA